MLYAEVILPLPIRMVYTYSVADDMVDEIEVGKRVLVQFGQRRLYAAVVRNILAEPPLTGMSYKPIVMVIDPVPVVTLMQLKFWDWVADYYMCAVGEVMQFALPSYLRMESKSRIVVNPEFAAYDELNERERQLLALLERETVYLHEGAQKHKIPGFINLLRQLVKKQAVYFVEEIDEPANPRLEKFVRLTQQAADEYFLHDALNKLSKAPRQKDLLETYLRLSDAFGDSLQPKPVSQKILLEVTQCSYTSLKSLIDKGILETYSMAEWEIMQNDTLENLPMLTPLQQQALNEINAAFEQKSVVLLHGVTGSGKTEIYFHLIAQTLQKGKQVLYMLPEIAITHQIIRRLKSVFSQQVLVYHSRLSDRVRMDVYQRTMLANEAGAKIILGVRSSVFLPFRSLGLIIIDEEHENSYKQYEPNPRYHARDAAIMLASMFSAKVLLGSATPSLESYYNASSGKYGLVKLMERYQGVELPRMEVVNMVAAQKKGKIQSHFSQILLTAMQECLEEKKQVILFHNRRGFAPYIQCQNCQYIFRCRHCDVSLTYHKQPLSLVCHYCGFSPGVPSACPQCGSTHLKIRGFGTEKIEEELAIFFPSARIRRMDQDAIRSREDLDEIIYALEQGELDILVGTQMITKGLDFANIGLVGILDADSLLNYPDFRAYERSFQLMVQVGGRAGRKNRQGKVIIQTYMPENRIIQMALRHDYEGMYHNQLAERKTFLYPPFTRLIHIAIRHPNEDKCEKAAGLLYEQLAAKLHTYVLKPQKPLVPRINNQYIRAVHLKIPPSISLAATKVFVFECIDRVKAQFSNVQFIPDVDPQ